jgi:hypothetical protein
MLHRLEMGRKELTADLTEWNGIYCNFSHITGHDVCLMRIQIRCLKADHTNEIKSIVSNLFSFVFVKYTPHQKMFQMKVAESNDVRTNCHVANF